MKLYPTLGIGIAIFAAGLLIGREYFPKNLARDGSADQDTDRGLSAAKPLFGDRRQANHKPTAATAASVTGVLELVDIADTHATANRLRDALAELGADELEEILAGLEGQPNTDAKVTSARANVFYYLAMADPARALAYTLGHPDKQFRRTFTALAVQHMAKSDLAAARQALDRISDHYLRKTARDVLVKVAIDSDPAMVAELLREAASDARPKVGYSFLSGDNGSGRVDDAMVQWALNDPQAAETYARSLENFSQRSKALTAIAKSRAQTDPEAALAWARGLEAADGQAGAVKSVLKVMAETDPQRVAGMLDELSSARDRNWLLSSVAASWIKQDRAAGLAWLESQPISQARLQAYHNAIYNIAQEDPQAAIGLLDQLPLSARNKAIPSIVSSWAQKDLDAARDWVTAIEEPAALNAGLNAIFSLWSDQDPLAALEFLGDSSGHPIHNLKGYYTTLADQWGRQDQQAALDWAQGIGDDDIRQSALTNLYSQWAKRDPQEAAAQLDAIADPIERKILLDSVANKLPSHDPQAAIDWYDQLAGEDRASVGSAVLRSLAHSLPQQAAARFDLLVAEGEADEAQLRDIGPTIVTQWSRHAPLAAANWAAQITLEAERLKAVANVTATWAQFDPVAVSAWIGELPAGEMRDGAAKQLVTQVAHTDPASAFEWAQSIAGGDARFNATQTVVNRWKHVDEESARAAIAQANITAEQRQLLEDQLE